MKNKPVTTDLVLIGGGHAHAIALRMFGMKPLPGVRLTLVTEVSETAYSGMLPGRVAGFYADGDCHINLSGLAEFAQAQLYLDRVVGLDLAAKQILCANRPPVAFDVVSIDIGSTPTLPMPLATVGAMVPAKPVPQFLHRWDQWVAQVKAEPGRSRRLAIVGGGAGGVELALNMQRQLHAILAAARQPLSTIEIHLIHRGDQVLPRHNVWVRDRFRQILHQRQIRVHWNEEVETVNQHQIRCRSGLELVFDFGAWVTQASAPDWLAKAGLATDDKGFVLVNDGLQSCSHPAVFAAGDIATMGDHPCPKAGVFAVRQAKPLVNNLRRYLQGRSLRPYRPQKRYLSLIGTGQQEAVASWDRWGWQSGWLWRWKEHIDRQFIARLNELPEMMTAGGDRVTPSPTTSVTESLPTMYCAGCGSKVPRSVLERVLHRIQQEAGNPSGPSPLIGLAAPDDAAVIQVPPERALVQTVDYFSALVNDPYTFGQIAANHALSDVFAMGATPHSALAIATIPHGTTSKIEETLYQLLAGALSVLHEAGATLIGGHTVEGDELAFGLTCNGLVLPHQILRKSGMQSGQALILTKAIGTGTLFAAKRQRRARGWWLDAAMQSMQQSNQGAVLLLQRYGATACTDVTGFGLVGHLLEMVQAAQVAVELELAAIPLLPGALHTVEQGILSSLQAQNQQAAQLIANRQQVCDRPQFPLLFDPQTAGGLLATVPIHQAPACVAALHQAGYGQSAVIGRVQPLTDPAHPIAIIPA